jgi:hypothetical protein
MGASASKMQRWLSLRLDDRWDDALALAVAVEGRENKAGGLVDQGQLR